jgi:hypothetical protein
MTDLDDALAIVLATDSEVVYGSDPLRPSKVLHERWHDALARVHNGLAGRFAAIDIAIAAKLGLATADGRYVRTVNGVGPDGAGNVPVIGGGGGSGGAAGVVSFEDTSFSGSTDEARLTSLMSYAAAQTTPPTILLTRPGDNRYVFTTTRPLYEGFKIRGASGPQNPEKSASTALTPTRVECNVPGGMWLDLNTATKRFGVGISQLAFLGQSGTQWMGNSLGGVLWCALIRDVAFTSFRSILGSQASSLLLDAVLFDGWWNMANSYNGHVHIGGADCTLWPEGGLVDSGAAFAPAGADQYHLWLDYLEKCVIGPLYMTVQSGWGGLRIDGAQYNSGSIPGNAGGPVVFTPGLKVEGVNAGAPADGALMRMNGGIVDMYSPWFGYAMADPVTAAHSPVDAGYVHQTGGHLDIVSPTMDRATGQAETVPLVYSTGGVAHINRVKVATKGGLWAGKPGTKQTGTAVINRDTTTAVL